VNSLASITQNPLGLGSTAIILPCSSVSV